MAPSLKGAVTGKSGSESYLSVWECWLRQFPVRASQNQPMPGIVVAVSTGDAKYMCSLGGSLVLPWVLKKRVFRQSVFSVLCSSTGLLGTNRVRAEMKQNHELR